MTALQAHQLESIVLPKSLKRIEAGPLRTAR